MNDDEAIEAFLGREEVPGELLHGPGRAVGEHDQQVSRGGCNELGKGLRYCSDGRSLFVSNTTVTLEKGWAGGGGEGQRQKE